MSGTDSKSLNEMSLLSFFLIDSQKKNLQNPSMSFTIFRRDLQKTSQRRRFKSTVLRLPEFKL